MLTDSVPVRAGGCVSCAGRRATCAVGAGVGIGTGAEAGAGEERVQAQMLEQVHSMQQL
jgi:hypothetical protein